MNMFKPTTAKTPKEYINMIAEPRKSEILKLHQFIQKIVPDLKPHILYGMIGYGSFHYKYASGREGDWSIIALASQKNYISVYVCAAEDGQYIAEKNKQSLQSSPTKSGAGLRDKPGKVSVGRSCIRFKKTEDVDMKQLERVIKEGVKAAKAGNFFA